MQPESGARIRLPDACKLAINQKKTFALQFANTMSSSKIIDVDVDVSYWSKFHVNIMTGSGVMTIFVYKVLARNLEMGNIIV